MLIILWTKIPSLSLITSQVSPRPQNNTIIHTFIRLISTKCSGRNIVIHGHIRIDFFFTEIPLSLSVLSDSCTLLWYHVKTNTKMNIVTIYSVNVSFGVAEKNISKMDTGASHLSSRWCNQNVTFFKVYIWKYYANLTIKAFTIKTPGLQIYWNYFTDCLWIRNLGYSYNHAFTPSVMKLQEYANKGTCLICTCFLHIFDLCYISRPYFTNYEHKFKYESILVTQSSRILEEEPRKYSDGKMNIL